MNRNTKGMLFALIGGVGWGFSGACSQFLFRYGTDPLWASAVAMLLAGTALLAVAALKSRSALKRLWSDGRAVAHTVLFALVGLAACRATYLLAIQHSNAGTATVLQYIGPVLIVVAACFTGRRLPSTREAVAVACVVVGTFLLATHGNIGTLALSPEGIFWGLAAAVFVAVYSLVPGSLMRRFGSVAVVGSGMAIGGAVLVVATQAWAHVPALDAAGWLALLGGLTFIGTFVGFTAYLQAINDIGAAKASLTASVETVSATVCAVVWLGTSFAVLDLVGFALIMVTVFVLAHRNKPASDTASGT